MFFAAILVAEVFFLCFQKYTFLTHSSGPLKNFPSEMCGLTFEVKDY